MSDYNIVSVTLKAVACKDGDLCTPPATTEIKIASCGKGSISIHAGGVEYCIDYYNFEQIFSLLQKNQSKL